MADAKKAKGSVMIGQKKSFVKKRTTDGININDSSPKQTDGTEVDQFDQQPETTEFSPEPQSPKDFHDDHQKSHSTHHHEVFSMRAKRQTLHDYENLDFGDDIGEDEPCGEIMLDSERIVRTFLHAVGRFPLKMTKLESFNEVVEFRFIWKSPQGVYFGLTTVIIFFCFLMGLINLFLMAFDIQDKAMELKFGEGVTKAVRARETALFHRGFLILITVGMGLGSSIVCSILIILRRHEFADYFAFWTRSLQTSQLDVSPTIFSNTIKIMTVTIFVSLIIIPTTFAGLASMVNGSTLMSVMVFRLMSPLMLLGDNQNKFSTEFYIYQHIGILIVLFSFLWSRSFILVYYIKAKMLINAIGQWNGRVYGAILRSNHPQTEEGRTTYKLLFKDHCLLLDLVQGTNDLFQGILESYFAAHTVSMIFEILLFFVSMRLGYRLDLAGEQELDESHMVLANSGRFFIRRHDWIGVVLLFVGNQVFYFMVLLTSADVQEELMGGLEIARRTSLIGRKTDEEMFFLLSLYNSFNRFQPTHMEGGGFFSINKELFLGFMAVVVLCVAIGLLFRPIFDWTKDSMFLTFVAILVWQTYENVNSHGRLMEPPNRSSLWRFKEFAPYDPPINYDDNQLSCGGVAEQYIRNGGKCGPCGDDFAQVVPRDNENGGKYGRRIIVRKYDMGQKVPVAVQLTRSHLGYFEFQICPLGKTLESGAETETCFGETLQLADESGTKYSVSKLQDGYFNTTVILPMNMRCGHCSFRWHYRTGNSYGDCGNGTGALGCGNQEIFRGCADITIS